MTELKPAEKAPDPDQATKVSQAPAPKEPAQEYFKYVGLATHRVIRPAEWPVAIKSGDRPERVLVWEPANGHMVSTKGLSADVVQCIKDQGDFVLMSSGR